MALRSFGKITVTTAGTPVQVSSTRAGVQSITVFALAGNSGTNIYIGNSAMNKSTLAGVYAIVAKGNNMPIEIPMAPAGLNAADIYLDADTSNDAALVVGTEQ